MADRTGFDEFAATGTSGLFRYAYFLCGDWHEAEDLVQATLVKLYVAWRRIERQERVDAYARRTLLRSYLSHHRLKRSAERPTAQLPQTIGAAEDADLRLTLIRALRTLPPRNRAVVVLRYLEGHSIDSVADILGMTPSTVKHINHRSLAALRVALHGGREDLFQQ